MKNMMIGACAGLSCGMGVMAYCLTNQKTKQKADKVLNKAMDSASDMLDDVKRKMSQSFFFNNTFP